MVGDQKNNQKWILSGEVERKGTPCAARLSGVESLPAMWETTAVQSLHESEAASANMAEVRISTFELESVIRSCPAQYDVMRLSFLLFYANLGGYLHCGVLSKVKSAWKQLCR